MKNKIKVVLIVGALSFGSFYFSNYARKVLVGNVNYSVGIYEDLALFIKDKISTHFKQADEIKALKAQNAELEKSATLLSTFAYELNNILSDKNSTIYSPKVTLARALTYFNIGDYSKVWLDIKGLNPDKIYGMIYKGKTAGIVINKDGMALGLLQTDPSSMFSVYIGDKKIAGIAKGNGKNIIVKYISSWLAPKVGDEVYTSGLDGIFFGGVLVGKIVEVKEEDLYKSALVEPDNKIEVPSYLYVVTKER